MPIKSKETKDNRRFFGFIEPGSHGEGGRAVRFMHDPEECWIEVKVSDLHSSNVMFMSYEQVMSVVHWLRDERDFAMKRQYAEPPSTPLPGECKRCKGSGLVPRLDELGADRCPKCHGKKREVGS